MSSSVDPWSYRARYVALASVSALLAFSFHAGVNRRFRRMEEGLNTATFIRYGLEWDELMELEYYNQAYEEHNESLQHLLLAFDYARIAHLVRENITKEQKELFALQEDADEEKKRAEEDEKEASMWAMRAFGDGRQSAGAELVGFELAKQASAENERGQLALQHANQTLMEGTKKLHDAKESLELAEEAKNRTKLNKGLCRWMPFACTVIRGGASSDGNTTYPAEPTDMAIQANKDIQDALEQIHDANEERQFAMELLVNASTHANFSAGILQDAKMYQEQEEAAKQNFDKYNAKEIEDETDYSKDEKFILEEKLEIRNDKLRMFNYTNTSRSYLELATHNYVEFQQSVQRFERSKKKAFNMQILLAEKTNEAKHHVSKAGWSALVASVAAACLFTLVVVQIVASFRYQRPLGWIVRKPPETTHDILYLLNHIFIFMLSIGYVGELLIDFEHETNLARVAILVVFSTVGATLQVTLLHFIPHLLRIQQASHLNWSASRILLKEDVVKMGLLVSMVFAIEMMLCWVNIGTVAFTNAFLLNNWWCWITVALLTGCYLAYVFKSNYFNRQIDTSTYLSVFDNSLSVESHSTRNSQRSISNLEEEKRSLLIQPLVQSSVVGPGSDAVHESTHRSSERSSGSHVTPDRDPSAKSSSSLKSIPLECAESQNYGALADDHHSSVSILPEIQASFLVSWRAELEKVCLLFEVLVASAAIWIIRRDVYLIIKLAPLARDVVWGRCPLWILNIFLLFILAIFALSFKLKQ